MIDWGNLDDLNASLIPELFSRPNFLRLKCYLWSGETDTDVLCRLSLPGVAVGSQHLAFLSGPVFFSQVAVASLLPPRKLVGLRVWLGVEPSLCGPGF